MNREPESLLTPDGVRQLKLDYETALAAALEAQAMADDLAAKINAVKTLIGPAMYAHLVGEKPPRHTEMTWSTFIANAIKDEVNGVRIAEITNMARNHPEMAERANKNANSIYTAIIRMHDKGELVKVGRTVFAPEWAPRDEEAPSGEKGASTLI